jgi:hypothetical protein
VENLFTLTISEDMSIAENMSIPVILRRILAYSLSHAYFDISFDTVSICRLIASMDAIDVFRMILSTGVIRGYNDFNHSIPDLPNRSVKSV